MDIRYSTNILIYNDFAVKIYRGVTADNNEKIFIKILAKDYPSQNDIAILEHENEMMSQIQGNAVPKVYGISRQEGKVALLYEDFDGSTLATKIAAEKIFSAERFLHIAILIVKALSEVHANKIIHKNINPKNILISYQEDNVKLIGFDLSSSLPKENLTDPTINQIGGDLAYISPEQTGRMNQSVDYRSDYYSLGVVFYQMLTGQLPYADTDPLALIYDHMVIMPSTPKSINDDIPEVLSNIVMKLLSKKSKDRYQTSHSLLENLITCKIQLEKSKEIKPFELGKTDIKSTLQISEKLYGRDEEIKFLLKQFELTLLGLKNFILISGPPGVGKTSLINELYKPITKKKGIFIRGKFDLLQKQIPYSALIAAMNSWLKLILMEEDAVIANWKKRLQKALGSSAYSLIKIFPKLELIIGKQIEYHSVSGHDEEQRLITGFANLINEITRNGPPLLLFLDDLQWIDASTSKLLLVLFSSEKVKNLCVVGAFRDSEVNTTHPLTRLTQKLSDQQCKVVNIYLSKLGLNDTTQWLSDTLTENSETVRELATECYKKTAGNPFFLTQFVLNLYDNNLLYYDEQRSEWLWKIEEIRKKQLSENVVDLMVEKIKRLPQEKLKFLTLAACIGNEFDLGILSKVSKDDITTVCFNIMGLFNDGLIAPLNSDYKYKIKISPNEVKCGFVHDKIQEAAYSLIPTEIKERTHYDIGKIFLSSSSYNEIQENLFDIVNHLNNGEHYINNEEEMLLLTRLNLMAAQKALKIMSFNAARILIERSKQLLPDNAWTSLYSLTLIIYQTMIEIYFNTNEFEKLDDASKTAKYYAKTALDKYKVYDFQILSYAIRGDLNQCVALGREILGELGLKLPIKPKAWHTTVYRFKIFLLLLNKKISNLINLPIMEKPIQQAIIRLLVNLGGPAGYMNYHYFTLTCAIDAYITIKYGLSEESVVSFGDCVSMFCFENINFEKAYQFGELVLKLAERHPGNKHNPTGLYIANSYIRFYKENIRQVNTYLLENYYYSKEVGESVYGVYSVSYYLINIFYACSINQTLDSIKKESLSYQKQFESHDPKRWAVFETQLNMIDILMGRSDIPDDFSKVYYPFQLSDDKFNQGWANFHKVSFAYLFERYDQAANCLEEGYLAPFFPKAYGYLIVMHIFDSLIRLKKYKYTNWSGKRKILKRVNYNQKIIKKWMKQIECNFIHYYFLVEAEKFSVTDKHAKAEHFYEEAISAAIEHNFIFPLALGYELAAKHYLAINKKTIAEAYMRKALLHYSNWGAMGKVNQLKIKYPELTEEIITLNREKDKEIITSQSIDLKSILQASQILSGDVVLTSLITNMLKLLLQNAGAEKAILLRLHDQAWIVEACAIADLQSAKVNVEMLNVPVTDVNLLSQNVVNYVIHSEETFIDNNLAENPGFMSDPYVLTSQPKSVLCMPIMRQKRVNSVLYLENNQANNVFTAERIQILNTLSSQITISLENADTVDQLGRFAKASERFVPKRFLQILKKKNIEEVKLGDCTEQKITVLFTDIRNFTTILEKFSAYDAFDLVNRYLKYTAPVITKCHGIISKYTGDGILALFPRAADDALQAGIATLSALKKFNAKQAEANMTELTIGIGINTGPGMLGIIGVQQHLEPTVVSDVVNTAARIESLNKVYGTDFLLNDNVINTLVDPNKYPLRRIDKVRLKGKTELNYLYEIADWQSNLHTISFTDYLQLFDQAFHHYEEGNFKQAKDYLLQCQKHFPDDKIVRILMLRCIQFIRFGAPDTWDGAYRLTSK